MRNHLHSLPNSFCTLSHLEKVNLAYNELIHLPDCFSQQNQLKWFNLAHNNLEKLPHTLSKMESLDRLIILGNPLDFEAVQRLRLKLYKTQIDF